MLPKRVVSLLPSNLSLFVTQHMAYYLMRLTGRISTLKISSFVAEISNTANATCEVSGRNALFLRNVYF